MKHLLRSMALMAVITLSSPLAHALDMRTYAGVAAGGYNVEITSAGIKGSDTVGGGYMLLGADFNEYAGAEFRIGGMANATVTFGLPVGVDISTDYIVSYFVKPQFPVGEDARIYGLIGGSSVSATATVLGITAWSATGSDLSYGVGADYGWGEDFHLGAEWVRYITDVSFGADTMTVDGFVASAKFYF